MRSHRTKHLDRTINIAAHIWNHALALHRRYYKLFGKSPTKNALQQHLAKLRRTRFKHWQLVGSQSLQEVTDRLYRGYEAFFEAVKLARTTGTKCKKRPPQFRSRRKYKSFTLKQAGYKILADGRVQIQGHNYRFHQSRKIEGDIKTVTVRRDTTGRHYISFSCDNVPQPEAYVKTGLATGVDFGLKTFLTLSQGPPITAPQPFKQALGKLASAQQKLSRKVKGSNSRKKAVLEVARIHRRVANVRSDFHWQTAVTLAKTYDALFFEDLNLVGMKALWGRKVSDLAFSDFLLKQKHICLKRDKFFGQTPRFAPTTKRMSCCGNVQKVELSERVVTCKACGTIHDRDVNAAINIEQLGRQLWPGVD